MAFISSKLIQIMESIFHMSEDPNLIKDGEMELLRLREQPQYQLVLANFLSRQSNYHHRIFVSLELEKRIIIQNSQTVRILHKSYFQDLDKIAAILRKVLTHPENLSWAGDLLIYNFDAMGVVESIRYIELLYSLLQKPSQAGRLVQQNFDLLLSSYSQAVEVVAESEDSLFMLLVTLSMFYRSSLNFNPCLLSKISQQWTFITDKCKYYGTPYIDLLIASIEASLHLHSSPYSQGSLGQLVFSILSSQLNRNEMKKKYEGKCLELVLQSGNVFADRRAVIEVIDSFNLYSRRINQDKLLQSSLKSITELNNELQEEMENQHEVRARNCLHQLIEEIFQARYKSVAEEYQEQEGRPLFLYMMPLVNYYSSCRSSSIEEWVRDHIEGTINHLGWFLSSVKFQGKTQGIFINDCVSCLELLVRFKALIPIKLLSHIGTVLQEVSNCCSSLSSLCYLFLQQVWEEIANLDFNDLSDFLFNHLQKLNFNEWDHCLHFYTCFLNLALHLEDRYQFYSHLLLSDPLILESLKTHCILVDLLMDSPESEVDLEVVSKLITLTGCIFLSLGGEQMLKFHGQLKVSFLADLLERHQLYRKENVNVVVWQWLITGRMVVSLEFRSALDSSQDEDEAFRELVRSETEHFQGLKTKISGY